MQKLGVIFDMDGVLVDSYQAHYESWRRMADARGLGPMNEEQFAATFGRTSREIIPDFWAGKVAQSEIAQLDALKEAAFRDIIAEDFPEMDGASELLRSLHEARLLIAVGSSAPVENVQAVLDAMPEAELISARANGMEVTHGKPHPEVFLLAARRLGVECGDCLVVEDAPAGIEAARRAGMAVIALTGTAPREKLSDANRIVDSLRQITAEDVVKLIRRHNHECQADCDRKSLDVKARLSQQTYGRTPRE